MKSRIKRIMSRKRQTTSVNRRGAVHKYFPINEHHSLAVQVGRCRRCSKITECYCDSCNQWFCEKHLNEKNEFCKGCEERDVKVSYFG